MVQIPERELIKEHAAGSCEIKQLLEKLAPKLFKNRYPYTGISMCTGNIVYFTTRDTGYLLNNQSDNRFGHLYTGWKEDNFKECEIKAITEEQV